jgi:hypothetical protein
MKLTEKNGKDFIIFKNSNIHELERRAEEFEKKQEKI